MRQEITFRTGDRKTAVFFLDDKKFWLSSLYGMLCGSGGDDRGPFRAAGMFALATDTGVFEAGDFSTIAGEATEQSATVTWKAGDSPLRIESRWRFDPATQTISRNETLVNTGKAPVTVFRFLCRVSLQRGRYEAYTQSGRWSYESQGAWQPVHAGTIALGCENGRTAQGATPYACVRPVGSDTGLVIHVLPCGNWTIKISTRPEMHGDAYCSIDAGMADEELHLVLKPGERFDSPEILYQPLVDGRPERSAPLLHRYALDRWYAKAKPAAPVIYNTWIDRFERLMLDNMRAQLAAAREIGVEVFVVDAGWYGHDVMHGWFDAAGDWREATNRSFFGNMKAFADEVRAAGLRFGLWMEPEHVGGLAPVRQEHPDWFKGGGRTPTRLDLENPAAYAWLKAEMSRLIETYDLAWMKIDFNIQLGRDERGSELNGYYRAWYGLMDEMRAAYPAVWFEGCASGAMRLELASLTHFDNHFPTDTVNPVDVIRIMEGTSLRIVPGRIDRWLVLRSVGRTLPDYESADIPESVATPVASGWQPRQFFESTDLDFTAVAAMMGHMGFSGAPATLTASQRQRIGEHVAFYKQWREFITAGVFHQLTPVRPIEDRTGWSVVQVTGKTPDKSLVYALRLNDRTDRRRFTLHDLAAETNYAVSWHPRVEGALTCIRSGWELMEEGLDIVLPQPGNAAIAVIEKRG